MLKQDKIGVGPAVCFVALLVGGCEVSVPSPAARLSIRTVEDTVTLQRSADQTAFAVTAIVRNDDTRLAQVELCGMQAQRDISGVWTTVFTPWCSSNALRNLAPRDSVVIPVDVFGYTLPNRIPALDPRMGPGRYRLLFGIGWGDSAPPTGSSRSEVKPSVPFIVK